MKTQPVHFYSDKLKLTGSFFRPDDWSPDHKPAPLIVPCSGFTGLARIHPARFARYLTARGHQCFGFDYRGFADSEGERGVVLLQEQVRDMLAAVAFAAADQSVDASQIILLGWGMGGGLVLDAGRQLSGVIGVAVANGFYDGRRFQEAHRNESQMQQFLEETNADRTQRARTGQARWADPFDIYPLDPESRVYVDNVLRKTPGYEAERYSFELADSLLRWNVEAYAPQMRIPLLVTHGDRNKLHPTHEAESLHAAYGGPKELYWIKDAGHTEFMLDEDPKFQALAGRIQQWVAQLLEA